MAWDVSSEIPRQNKHKYVTKLLLSWLCSVDWIAFSALVPESQESTDPVRVRIKMELELGTDLGDLLVGAP